jgi:type IV secretory pathway VirB10-like protein
VANPKDSTPAKEPATKWTESVRPMESPDGLDLHPEPRKAVRISRRAGMAILLCVVGLLLAFAYGGYRRTKKAQSAAREATLPKNVSPATQAGSEFTKSIPDGTAPLARRRVAELQPPDATASEKAVSPCGSNPQTGPPFRFNPQTGQPCDGLPQERLVVRHAPVPRVHAPVPVVTSHEPTPEERRLAVAYAREQEARMAPTSVRVSAGSTPIPALASNSSSSADDLSRLAALTPAVTHRAGDSTPTAVNGALPEGESGYEGQNMQTRKESFLNAVRDRQSDDYLRSTRDAPLSLFEIKAGWEIPAVLEQNLNSDLPGELKALITASVYDTATGQYLLILQGSRLVGKYDSRVAYGQDGVQVAWSRIIFPDASSIDLNGMVGLDAHGNAGLRDKVDRHYTRLIGFAALTSLFSAAFEISQRQNQSVLAYPTPTEAASSAVGRELSQTGTQITRRNLNVQPTIKVPVGYRFTVRVNRDILFEAPYEPMQADPQPLSPGEKSLRQRSAWEQGR